MSHRKERVKIKYSSFIDKVKRITHSYIFLFSKEAHANIVPERRALRHSTCCHSVLVHGHIKVPMSLHHAACSQDGLGIKTMIRDILEEDVPFELAHDDRPPDRMTFDFDWMALKEVQLIVFGLLSSKLSLYQGVTYLIIVGVKSEGISKVLKSFLVFPQLAKTQTRKIISHLLSIFKFLTPTVNANLIL